MPRLIKVLIVQINSQLGVNGVYLHTFSNSILDPHVVSYCPVRAIYGAVVLVMQTVLLYVYVNHLSKLPVFYIHHFG